MYSAVGQPARTAPAKLLLRTRVTWVILLIVASLHGAVAVAQPVLAGSYLNGNLTAMQVHGPLGSGLVSITMFALAPAAVLFLFPGKGSWLPLVTAVLLFLGEGLQIGMGYTRQFGIHIPLGVAIVGVSVALVWYLVAWRYRAAKKLRGQQ